MTWRTLALLALAAALTGCTKTRSFRVAVLNDTGNPITVGFAKEDGGPYERAWATPEEIAIDTPRYSERNWDSVIIPPGRTGEAGPIEGRFDSAARAFLRVYATEGKLNDLLAISEGSPRRADVPLKPGRNRLVVREEAGRLVVERVRSLPPGGSGGEG